MTHPYHFTSTVCFLFPNMFFFPSNQHKHTERVFLAPTPSKSDESYESDIDFLDIFTPFEASKEEKRKNSFPFEILCLHAMFSPFCWILRKCGSREKTLLYYIGTTFYVVSFAFCGRHFFFNFSTFMLDATGLNSLLITI